MSCSIDIISITKNDIDGIRRTIQSTRHLRRHAAENGIPLRQIVIDGSAPDLAAEVLLFSKNEDSVSYFHEAKPGISLAFNRGIQESDAEWIWMLNGGDELLEDAPIPTLLDVTKKTGSDVIIFSGKNRGKIQHTRPLAKLWPIVYCWIIHNAALVRRSVLLEFGGYREDYKIAMDAELWIRIFGYYKQADVIDIPLVNFEGGGVSDNLRNRGIESKKMLWDNKRLLWGRLFDYPRICWEAWKSYSQQAGRTK
jgi:glycosyltransferase involved in cell wall biosynthesis